MTSGITDTSYKRLEGCFHYGGEERKYTMAMALFWVVFLTAKVAKVNEMDKEGKFGPMKRHGRGN